MKWRITVVVAALFFSLLFNASLWAADVVGTVHVNTVSDHVLNSFDPDSAFGTCIDVLDKNSIDHIFTPHILRESLSAGWGTITYRNNSELSISDWHWNPNGKWSDEAHQQGYFTGSTELKEPIRYILSYGLPHRGFSASGDNPLECPTLSYWKSNPYLTHKFTGESDASHPQWVVLNLRSPKPVNAVKIDWKNPYATTYQVEYWVADSAAKIIGEGNGRGDALDFDGGPKGEWKTSESGSLTNANGGTVTLKLLDKPVSIQFLRVLMTESSNTCDEHGSGDSRNCAGYAIAEFEAGTLGEDGSFVKAAEAEPVTEKNKYCASSIDPWHEAKDVKADGGYQHTGFDLFFTSGITNNLPAMIPVAMIYGTPEDAAAQIAYVEKRGYPISYVELGEEPDGKHTMPEDDAELFIQWARAIHKVDPKLKLGGPVFEGVNEDIKVWPDAKGRTSWLGRFVDYLREHGRLSDLAFVSFEHYPFDPCPITWKDLYKEPYFVKHIQEVWRQDGVPKEVPLMITESSISWQTTGTMSTMFGALWLADSYGAFFEGGGAAYYHFYINPSDLEKSCSGWTSWSNFVMDKNYNIRGYTSLYFAAHMLNQEWVQHRSGVHQMFPASTDIKDSEGNLVVTSYAVCRPDGNWSLMLVNKDETRPHQVKVVFGDSEGKDVSFSGKVFQATFGSEQYVWKDDGENSHADPDGPPVSTTVTVSPKTIFTLPKASITVLRGKIER